MSDDLRKLIEVVETGKHFHFSETEIPSWVPEDSFVSAFNGSVDTAIALCEALLPGWVATVDTTGFAHVYKDEFEVTHNASALLSRQPARALLLAVLRAKLMEVSHE